MLTPILLPTTMPCIFAVRPMTAFTMPLVVCTWAPKTSSIGPAEILLGVGMVSVHRVRGANPSSAVAHGTGDKSALGRPVQARV